MRDVVRVERVEDVLLVSIDRPAVRNAVDRAVAEGIAAAMRLLDADDSLRVGVLSGTGGTFCSGMDLTAYLNGDLPVTDAGGFAGIVEAPPVKPLVAAVEGHAVAGGFEIVLSCDLVVAAQDAAFGLPEVRRGLVAGGGGLLRLRQRLPHNEAMRLALTGSVLSAARAHELGLVSLLVPPGQAVARACELASEIAANGPRAVLLSKRIVTESEGWPLTQRFARQAELTSDVLYSAEAQEGARAFLERRSPRWPGSGTGAGTAVVPPPAR